MSTTLYLHRDAMPYMCEIGPRAGAAYGGNNATIRAIKFLHAKDKQYWLEDFSFLIRPWSHYLSLEQGDQTGVADSNEGKHEIKFDRLTASTGNPGDAEHFERLHKIGHLDVSGNIQPNADFTFVDKRIGRTAPPAHILCFGSEFDTASQQAWSRAEGYDAALEILDLAALAIELQLASKGRLSMAGLEAVEYGPQVSRGSGPYYTGHTLFRKDDRFSWQNELRVMWQASVTEQVVIHAPAARKLIREIW